LDLPERLLGELVATQARLDQWLETAPFTRPSTKPIPDPTFKTFPLNSVAVLLGVFLARLDANTRAVVALCQAQMTVPAQPVVRAILESAVDLRYISTNPQVLTTKWCLFEQAKRYRFWSKRPESERPSDFGFLERQTQARLRQLDRHCPHANGKPWKVSEITRDWDFTNLSHREKVGREAFDAESAFYGVYRLLSGSVHGGVDSVTDYVVTDSRGRMHLVRHVGDRKQVFVPWAALHCVATTLNAARRCGAQLPEDVGPQWHTLELTNEELLDRASADWRHPAVQD